MRIAITADLHWERETDRPAVTALAENIGDLDADVLVLAGDIGEGDSFAPCLSLFSRTPPTRLLTPGNHDIFSPIPGEAFRRYYDKLPTLAADHHFGYLDQQPYLAPDHTTAILGTINWFDYSFLDRNAVTPDIWDYCIKPGRDDDPLLGIDSAAFAAQLADHLQGQLNRLPDEVSQVVLITHYPSVRQLALNRLPRGNNGFRLLARAGNKAVEWLVFNEPRIKVAVCGHTHTVIEAPTEHIGAVGRSLYNVGGSSTGKRLLVLDMDGPTAWWEYSPAPRPLPLFAPIPLFLDA